MKKKFWINIILLCLTALVSACGSSSDTDATDGSDTDSGSSNWNQMKWDQDKWS